MSLTVTNVCLLFHYVLENCDSVLQKAQKFPRKIPCRSNLSQQLEDSRHDGKCFLVKCEASAYQKAVWFLAKQLPRPCPCPILNISPGLGLRARQAGEATGQELCASSQNPRQGRPRRTHESRLCYYKDLRRTQIKPDDVISHLMHVCLHVFT